MPRLRRVSIQGPGWTRRRVGRGFVYLDLRRERITDPEHLERIKALAIPPAWRDVWICPLPQGHIQAAGVDDAGRRQYLYHPQWRLRRDRLKHDHVLEVGRRLPSARRSVSRDLAQDGMPRSKVLALGFRLLDLAYFRAGGEGYAKRHGSYGLATLLREHVQVRADGSVRFVYPAKSGQVRDVLVEDDDVRRLVTTLKRRQGGGPELLAWRDDDGGWHDVTSADLVADVRERLGPEASPKDFRTWHATVLMARALTDAGPAPRSDRARRRIVTAAVRDVAEELGNTPAVCRASYIDPRVIDLWEHGEVIGPTRTRSAAERTTLQLLEP